MEKKYKFLSKNILLFAMSNILPRAISFFMVPLYTNCLSTSEYGIGDIVTTSASLALPIFSLSIYSGVLRFGFDEKYNKNDVISSGIYVFIRGFLICAVLALIFVNMPNVNINFSYVVAFLWFFLANGLYEVYTNYARTIEKINLIVEMSVLNTFSTCLLNILLLLYLNRGLEGYLVSNYLGTLLSVIYGTFKIKIWKNINFKYITKKTVLDLQRYSAPLILNRIGWWINNSSDRYIVTWLLGASANGIYTVAYKIPTILTAFSDVFAQAWQLSAIKEFDRDDRNNFVSDMYCAYNAFLTMCCSLLIMLSILLAKILYANDFFGAWRYVPLLLMSFMFNGLAAFFGSIFVVVKDSKIISSSTVLAATVNTGLNVILILIMKDPMGAAIATVISYMLIWLQRYIYSKKYIHLHFNVWKHAIMYVLLLVQYLLCLMGLYMIPVGTQFFIFICIVFLNENEIKKIIIILKRLTFKKCMK